MKKLWVVLAVVLCSSISFAAQVPGTEPEINDIQMDSVLFETWTFNNESLAIAKDSECWNTGCNVKKWRDGDKFRVNCVCPQPSYRVE